MKKQKSSSVRKVNPKRNIEYQNLADELIKKYGVPIGPYFLDSSLNVKNNKITRGKEGLFLHHIDEDKWIMLSSKEANIKFKVPYSVHLPTRLIYCNYLEHIKLHLLIFQHPETWKERCTCGIGGIINFICREINDWVYQNNRKKYEGSQSWRNKALECINLNWLEYIDLLKQTYTVMKQSKMPEGEILKLWSKSQYYGSQQIYDLKKQIIG